MKTILGLVTQRVEVLMKSFDKDKFVENREKAIRTFHDDVLTEMRSEDTQAVDLEPVQSTDYTRHFEYVKIICTFSLLQISETCSPLRIRRC